MTQKRLFGSQGRVEWVRVVELESPPPIYRKNDVSRGIVGQSESLPI